MRFFALFFLLAGFSACFSKKKEEILLNGAGASFPYVLYSKWIFEYRKKEKQVAVNYQSIGSGGGIRQFLAGTLDFGGTDVPVSKKNLKNHKNSVLHVPTALGAVAVTYHLKSQENLNFTGELLADIFLGKIQFWNDPKIKALNKSAALPNKKIILIYRADGSGTTSFFTEFLSLKSPDFLNKVGKGKLVSWPKGLGAKGNEGVMGLLSKMEGSLSYIGLSYALSQSLPVAAIKNKDSVFVKPSLESLQASALQGLKDNQSYMESLIDKKGKKTYPLSGYTYLIFSQKQPEKKGKALLAFLRWALTEGQAFSKKLHFTPLPDSVLKASLKTLSSVEFQKEAL